jgi:beta-carotene hydroxylase
VSVCLNCTAVPARHLPTPDDTKPLLLPLGEVTIGPPLSDFWGNPTVALFFAALLICGTGVASYLLYDAPAFLAITLNSIGLYLAFTVLHEAVHGVAHRRSGAGRALGTATGLLLTFTFPFFRGIHMRHHAQTNQRGSDPDALLALLPPWLAPWLGGTLLYLSYHISYFRLRLWRSPEELAEVVVFDLFYLGVLASAIAGGWLPQLLVLWIVPLVLTLHWLVYTFDYLPHHPHDSTERLYNARAYGGRMVALLHLNQNYHLIHHLWPKIPWFRYRRAYLSNFSALAARGCRVGTVRCASVPGRASDAQCTSRSNGHPPT